MNRFAVAILLALTVLALLLLASSAGDPPVTLVDAEPVCSTRPPVNPCSVQKCEPRIDTRKLT